MIEIPKCMIKINKCRVCASQPEHINSSRGNHWCLCSCGNATGNNETRTGASIKWNRCNQPQDPPDAVVGMSMHELQRAKLAAETEKLEINNARLRGELIGPDTDVEIEIECRTCFYFEGYDEICQFNPAVVHKKREDWCSRHPEFKARERRAAMKAYEKAAAPKWS